MKLLCLIALLSLSFLCLSALAFGQGADFTGKIPPPFVVKEYLNVKGGKPPDTKGKVVMYDFWTTWCGVCKRAIPRMIDIDHTFRKKGLVLISITYEEKPAVEKFLKTSKITYPVALDRGDKETFTAYGIVGVPTAYILDPTGHVMWNGQPEALIDSQIEDLLREGQKAAELASGDRLLPLTFDKKGEGQPVVLLHGLGGSARDWDKILPVWSKNMTLYAVDLYGHGRTPPLEKPATIADLARGVMQFIRKEKIERPVLVGHSMGGMVALQLAEANPSAFAALVIVDAYPGLKPFSAGSNRAERDAIAADAEQFIKEHWGKMATRPEDSERVVKSALATDRKTLLNLYWDARTLDLRPDLGFLRLPVLVVFAEPPGGFSPTGDPQKLYDGIPEINFSLISGVRHFIMLDDPRAFTITAFKFLAKNLGPGEPRPGAFTRIETRER
jgi:pimeloyl-ACP methyl ester carboxylesterase/peroxiredoxin